MHSVPRRSALLVVLIGIVACDVTRPESSEQRRPPTPAARRYEPSRVLGRIEERALVEVSGIVASRRASGIYWVHNDSGGEPNLHCVRASGASCGTVEVTGAEMRDWEDIATGVDGDLYIGDIGDNTRSRSSLAVYRIPEPEPPGPGAIARSEPAERLRFRFPRGSHDAETLLVHPVTEDLYVVTKGSPALVFRGPPDGGRARLVAAFTLPGLLSIPTAGDIAPDGRHVIIATYGRAFEFDLVAGRPFGAIWSGNPRAVRLPPAQQREAIAYRRDGRAIIATSEGRHAALVQRELASE